LQKEDAASVETGLMQWGSNRVSDESLPKTGIFAVVTRDFARNGLVVLQFGSPETGAELQKPANCGLFSSLRGPNFGLKTAWLAREDSNLDMANWNRTLSAVREEPQNLLSLKFIGPSKRRNFEIRTKSAESRALEINGALGEK
jgi:hypothetical protein